MSYWMYDNVTRPFPQMTEWVRLIIRSFPSSEIKNFYNLSRIFYSNCSHTLRYTYPWLFKKFAPDIGKVSIFVEEQGSSGFFFFFNIFLIFKNEGLSPSGIALSFDGFGSISWHSVWFSSDGSFSFHIFSPGFPTFSIWASLKRLN
jgi:hypothetical protein